MTAADLFGKNIEYSAAGPMFEDAAEKFITLLRTGVEGSERHGSLLLNKGDRFFSCHITTNQAILTLIEEDNPNVVNGGSVFRSSPRNR